MEEKSIMSGIRRAPTLVFWRKDMSDYHEGIKLNVEDFMQGVWIYGVESTPFDNRQGIEALGLKQKVVKVYYTGNNIYSGPYANLWPVGIYVDRPDILE